MVVADEDRPVFGRPHNTVGDDFAPALDPRA